MNQYNDNFNFFKFKKLKYLTILVNESYINSSTMDKLRENIKKWKYDEAQLKMQQELQAKQLEQQEKQRIHNNWKTYASTVDSNMEERFYKNPQSSYKIKSNMNYKECNEHKKWLEKYSKLPSYFSCGDQISTCASYLSQNDKPANGCRCSDYNATCVERYSLSWNP